MRAIGSDQALRLRHCAIQNATSGWLLTTFAPDLRIVAMAQVLSALAIFSVGGDFC